MMKWEESLKEWICKNALLFGYIAVAVLGLFLRYSYLPMLSADMEFLYSAWFDTLKTGESQAIFNPDIQFNYSPLHLYIWMLGAKVLAGIDTIIAMKLIAISFDVLVCLACFGIICRLTNNRIHRFAGFVLLLLNPVILWNASGWGQTDTCFASLSIFSVLFLMDEKPQWGLAALGVALAFKLQAIFILPLFIYAWFQSPKKFSILWFLLIPAIWIGSGIPMILLGKSPLYAVLTYLDQGNLYSEITYNYPNLYAIMGESVGKKPMIDGMVSRTGMSMAIALLGGLAVWMMHRRIVLKDKPLIVLLGAWCVMVCVFFLPRMHERYAIVAELLLVCWAIWLAKPRGFVYVVWSVIPVLSAYAQYLLRTPFFSLQLGGVMNLILIMALSWETIQTLRAQPRQA